MNTNVFEGPDALPRFLHPDNSAPLVELPPELNPFAADGVRIFAKVYGEQQIKLVTAYGMLEDARQKGRLEGVHTLVENTSGNTGVALDILKKYFGINRMVVVVPGDLAGGKLDTIRLHSMEYRSHYGNGIEMAIELGKQKGWLNLNQYANPANPAAHEKWTGPHILEAIRKVVGEDIKVFAAGLGTGGTLVGVSNYLRKALGYHNVAIVAALCAPEHMIPGVRDRQGMEKIKFDWETAYNRVFEVTTHDAYHQARDLFVSGIPAGPSSGLAFKGLLSFLEEEKAKGHLDHYRNGKGEIICVFVCPDSHGKYQEKVLTHLKLKDLKPPQ